MGGGSTKQCGALFCLTFCRLLYPIRKDKTASESKTFGARGSSVEKFIILPQNFNGLVSMRFPSSFLTIHCFLNFLKIKLPQALNKAL
jgi:hypothetical protein